MKVISRIKIFLRTTLVLQSNTNISANYTHLFYPTLCICIKGWFVVINFENHLNHIDFFVIQIIFI